MHPLETIDVNFKVETNIVKDDICFYSVLQEPFSIHGLHYENGQFRRMPESVAASVSPGVHYLHSNTAGGRVRFKTNSQYIAISTKMKNIGKMDHFALTGSAGFDLYVGEHDKTEFFSTFRPPFDMEDGYQSLIELTDCNMREVVINFPLYSDVCELYIGLQKDASVESAAPYALQKPVVFYGSSITQGGCASRPGNSYPAILSRWYDFDYINLGFSGNAKGETNIADYIAGLDMHMFVLDYDHNAPDVQHLQNTHAAMYQAVRAARPDIPIIMMTSPSLSWVLPQHFERRNVIYQTYTDAINNGDNNVYFWDGSKEFVPYADYGTVEGCHPNDCGFYGMAKSLSEKFNNILSR